MAIELHHLHPSHDDELMRLKERIAELEKEVERLQRYHDAEATKWLAENQKLKEKRRWRKFPEEKPSEEMEGEDFLVSNGYYSVVCEWRGYWNNDPFCGDRHCDEVKYWSPLPSEPKEEQ